jgi:iron complex transport system ATP-binding protein
MASLTSLLTTRNLDVGYIHRNTINRLFAGLNLSLRAGEMICFMGPNGAGKSSLLRTLAGLQAALNGNIDLNPTHVDQPKERQIAVVLTDRINAVNLTVEEMVMFGRYPYLGWNIRPTPDDRRIVQESIEQVNIQSLRHKKVYELSDGQLQMVMVARALAQDTPIMLLDEPTAHLDLNNRVEIMNLLRGLSRSMDKAILLATHELDLALQTADLIWLAGKKQDILQGWPEDLVLNGAFDEIFELKGFDLKSGKVLHEPFRGVRVQLTGEGPAYLWSKNALERNGFDVTRDREPICIDIVQESSLLKWVLKNNHGQIEVDSIENLMNSL